MRVIFLGFDNVLNNRKDFERLEQKYFDRPIPESEHINYRLLLNLKKIVEATGAEIVFTSESIFLPTYREAIYKAFKDAGLEICDKIFWQKSVSKGIERWVKDNRVDNYVIIDYERHPALQKFKKNFIKTSPDEGLTIEKAREAIKVLLEKGLEKRIKENTIRTVEIKVDGKKKYEIVFLKDGIEEIATTYNKMISWMDEEQIFGLALDYYIPEGFVSYEVVNYNNTLYVQGGVGF